MAGVNAGETRCSGEEKARDALLPLLEDPVPVVWVQGIGPRVERVALLDVRDLVPRLVGAEEVPVEVDAHEANRRRLGQQRELVSELLLAQLGRRRLGLVLVDVEQVAAVALHDAIHDGGLDHAEAPPVAGAIGEPAELSREERAVSVR